MSRASKRRIVTKVYRTGKPELIEMMMDLETVGSKREAALAYDAVTQAINGWLMAHSRTIPKGLHMKLTLTSCLTVNLCWIDRSQRPGPDILACWLALTRGAKVAIRQRRAKEYYVWKAKQQPHLQNPTEHSLLHHNTERTQDQSRA
jgi:hypothetical protein